MSEPTKPRVQKPPAEILGNWESVMKAPACTDGRDLFLVSVDKELTADFEAVVREILGDGVYIRAGSSHRASLALLEHLKVRVQAMTKGKMNEKYRTEYLRLQKEFQENPPAEATKD